MERLNATNDEEDLNNGDLNIGSVSASKRKLELLRLIHDTTGSKFRFNYRIIVNLTYGM